MNASREIEQWPMELHEQKMGMETSASSLGLGAALAVAYDLIEDPSFPGTYTESEIAQINGNRFICSTYNVDSQSPFTTISPPNQAGVFVFTQKTNNPTSSCLPERIKNVYYPLSLPATTCNSYRSSSYNNGWNQNSPNMTTSSITESYPLWSNTCDQVHANQQNMMINYSVCPPMTAYLNPIPTTLNINASGNPVSSTSSSSLYYQSDISYLDNGPASESTLSTDSLPSIRSDTMSSYQSESYTLKPISCSPVNITTPLPSRVKAIHSDLHDNKQSSTSSDDGLYELSEEDLKEIDGTLTQNPQVTSSRHWKYYIETNEWTRATCALMACLFSRDQMANSTVLGRGGSQRERLPTNLVAYVVTKMRRRFNKSAAAVRARMAQKCKDERRFGRVLPPMGYQVSAAVDSRRSLKSSTSGSRRRSTTKNQRLTHSLVTNDISRCQYSENSSVAVLGYTNSGSTFNDQCFDLHDHQHMNVPVSSSPYQDSTVLSHSSIGNHDPPVILASAPEMAS